MRKRAVYDGTVWRSVSRVRIAALSEGGRYKYSRWFFSVDKLFSRPSSKHDYLAFYTLVHSLLSCLWQTDIPLATSNMFTQIITLAALATAALAQSPAYGQCGGNGWTGATTCVSGYTCQLSNAYYSQCVPGSSKSRSNTMTCGKSDDLQTAEAMVASPPPCRRAS